MLYRARYLLSMTGPPLAHGALRVEDGRIVAFGRQSDLPPKPGEEVWEGPRHVLMPGLINAHAHLELHALRGRLAAGASFPDWVRGLRSITQHWTEVDYVEGCRLGALESLRHGTTCLVDIGNQGTTPQAVADLPLRVFACLEVLGLDPAQAEKRLAEARHRLAVTPNGAFLRKGLVPHAGYSLSLPLFRALAQAGESPVFSVHAGESREEEALFAQASGPLQAFCEGIFPAAPRHRGRTPLGYFREENLLPRRPLIVHANEPAGEEAAYLASLEATVVHCPQSHAFFGHKPFPAEAYRVAGVPLALGTDSLASGTSLSLWDALHDFHRKFPDFTAQEILAMVTVNPGLALDASGKLGCLGQGAEADFIGVRLDIANEKDVLEALVRESQDIALVVVGGQRVLE